MYIVLMWMGNEIWTEHVSTQFVKKNVKRDNRGWWWIVLVFPIIGLFWRSAEIQLGRGDYLSARAESQRIRTLVLPAPRGKIYDRNGIELVGNAIIYQKVDFDDQKGLVYQKISREDAMKEIASKGNSAVMEVIDRESYLGESGAHVLGYVGSVNESEMGEDKFCKGKNNSKESMIGRVGIEAFYDCKLKGIEGELMVEVNTAGKLMRVLGRKEPIIGESLFLTINGDLQQYIGQLMDDKKGAVVVMSPINGEIFALGSYPSFDPLWFSLRERENDIAKYSAQINALFNDPDKPLLNRAISSVYPPGSIFKLVSSLAGLESAKLNKDDYYLDTGVVKLGTYEFRNWYFLKYGSGEGQINVVKAIARSTDTFYYDLGGKLGPEPMAYWARRVNMGNLTGIDLRGEAKGLIPDPEWKLQTKGERWYLGNTYHMAIGQGDVLATPIQLASLTGIFTNGGMWCKPYLNKVNNPECISIEADDLNLDIVRQGMIGACSPGGTAGVFYNQPYQVACKTGTAEYGGRDENGYRKTHAWFTMAGPVSEDNNLDENNSVVITVFVESGGEGSETAAPIAKQIMDKWMEIN